MSGITYNPVKGTVPLVSQSVSNINTSVVLPTGMTVQTLADEYSYIVIQAQNEDGQTVSMTMDVAAHLAGGGSTAIIDGLVTLSFLTATRTSFILTRGLIGSTITVLGIL